MCYVVSELHLYWRGRRTGEDTVLCLLRISALFLLTMPNIAFRQELQKLLHRDHSRTLLLLSAPPHSHLPICASFLLFQLSFTAAATYYVSDVIIPYSTIIKPTTNI